MAKMNLVREFTKGIIKENPVLCLVLGTCPTLAVTTAASNAIGMGIAATIVLVCSNAVISLLRKIIPDKVRIPAYITIIAGFVTMVQMLVKAYAPDIDKALGIYLPLIVVNCIILGRAEMYASKHSVLPSVLDGLGMGVALPPPCWPWELSASFLVPAPCSAYRFSRESLTPLSYLSCLPAASLCSEC